LCENVIEKILHLRCVFRNKTLRITKDQVVVSIKTYLNRKERTDLVMLCAMLAYCEKEFPGWYERGAMTKDERKRTRTAVTNLNQTIKSMLNRLDKDFVFNFYKDMKRSVIKLMPKPESEIENRKIREDAKQTTINTEALIILAEKALDLCNPCHEKNYRGCNLRSIFMELGIEPFDSEAVEKCQYKISERT